MAETKPGLKLNEDGVCQACYHHDRQRESVDYARRFEMLAEIADAHRRDDGYYDCIIPVSGGKDSYFVVYMMSERLNMTPLLINVGDPFMKTEAGRRDLENIREVFDCDIISHNMGTRTARKMVRISFEEMGYPAWAGERAMQSIPIKEAIRRDIPLVVYGENQSWEYGGTMYDFDDKEPYLASDQIKNRVAKPVKENFWLDNGLLTNDLNQIRYPSEREIEDAGIEPIYTSYFIEWDGFHNFQIAKKWGFRDLTHEWIREGFIDNYDQIDTIGYSMNDWLKYPKFGFRRVTDVVGFYRRSDHFDITIKEGTQLIRRHDHKLDPRILDDFLKFTGYTDQEFWKIVDKWRNEDLFDEEFTAAWTDQRPRDDFENISI